MEFNKEIKFEDALCKLLKQNNIGWTRDFKQKDPRQVTQEDLWENFFMLMEEREHRNFTEDERQQIKTSIENNTKTPFDANNFLKGQLVEYNEDGEATIKLKTADMITPINPDTRDNALVYQVIRQPDFVKKCEEGRDSRGDVMLLINGLPLVHIELKRLDKDRTKAENQFNRYIQEKNYTGLYSFVQICCAMTPNDFTYFARPETEVNTKFCFHWQNSQNEPITQWQEVARQFLNTTMMFKFIWDYTLADRNEKDIKVLRSYQYFGCKEVVDIIKEYVNDRVSTYKGGYLYHATGSGKTMTAYMISSLVAAMPLVQRQGIKVITLVDRNDLDVQSCRTFKSFEDSDDNIVDTDTTKELYNAIFKDRKQSKPIITSQQKLNLLFAEKKPDQDSTRVEYSYLKAGDMERVKNMKIIFILDECHRGVYSKGWESIGLFENRLVFGVTGTPIKWENAKKGDITTETLFGPELHTYSVGNAIADGNVLGFDISYISTLNEKSLRRKIAEKKSNISDYKTADEEKRSVYNYWYKEAPLVEIEKYIPSTQYQTKEHRQKIVEYIQDELYINTSNYKYSAMLTTTNIPSALEYYREIKTACPELNVTCVVDANDSETKGKFDKLKGLEEVIHDYNVKFNTEYSLSQKDYKNFKKDVAKRLAHKDEHRSIGELRDKSTAEAIAKNKENRKKRIDLVIVVDQMLTGYDSKYLNTLLVDRELEYENIIQAMSRTNRVETEDKKMGMVVFFRKPATTKANVDRALKLYAGADADKVKAPNLVQNIKTINSQYESIKYIFLSEGIYDFARPLKDDKNISKFISEFVKMNTKLRAAKLQGLKWDGKVYQETEYKIVESKNGRGSAKLALDEETYNVLFTRFREATNFKYIGGGETPPLEISYTLSDAAHDKIDEDQVGKYLVELSNTDLDKDTALLVEEIKKIIRVYSWNWQKIACEEIIPEIINKELVWTADMSLGDEITSRVNARELIIANDFGKLGVNVDALLDKRQKKDISNTYGFFDDMENTVRQNMDAVCKFIEEKTGVAVKKRDAFSSFRNLLKDFILTGELDIEHC